MNENQLTIAAMFAAMTSLPEKCFRDIAALVPTDPWAKLRAKNAVFREKHADRIAECAEFNKTVNTRQVRRRRHPGTPLNG